MFKLQKYDYLFYFDFDMLVLKNIEHIFQLKFDFAAASTASNSKWFNGGFFIVGKKYLNKKIFNSLLALSKSRNWEGNEALLNSFFYKKVHFLESQYNTITIDTINIQNTSILHFVGEKKPWNAGGLTDKYDRNCVVGLTDKNLLFKVDLKYRQYYNKATKKFNEYKENSCGCTTR
jgi:lipopolysaccharide biosynthesis glycosyltransferase